MYEILLVEDDPLYAKILSYLLENNGYLVDCAVDGLQGMEMVGRKKYDLVVTDILMPFASGLDLLDHIRENIATRDIKVIIMSIMDEEFYISESLSRGADEYLQKPVTAKELLQSIRRHLYKAIAC